MYFSISPFFLSFLNGTLDAAVAGEAGGELEVKAAGGDTAVGSAAAAAAATGTLASTTADIVRGGGGGLRISLEEGSSVSGSDERQLSRRECF